MVAGASPFVTKVCEALQPIVLKLLTFIASDASTERCWTSFDFVHEKLKNWLNNERVMNLAYAYQNLSHLDYAARRSRPRRDCKKTVLNEIPIDRSSAEDEDPNI